LVRIGIFFSFSFSSLFLSAARFSAEMKLPKPSANPPKTFRRNFQNFRWKNWHGFLGLL